MIRVTTAMCRVCALVCDACCWAVNCHSSIGLYSYVLDVVDAAVQPACCFAVGLDVLLLVKPTDRQTWRQHRQRYRLGFLNARDSCLCAWKLETRFARTKWIFMTDWRHLRLSRAGYRSTALKECGTQKKNWVLVRVAFRDVAVNVARPPRPDTLKPRG